MDGTGGSADLYVTGTSEFDGAMRVDGTMTVNSALNANSITTAASSAPAEYFNDSDDTGTQEGAILVNCEALPETNDCDMSIGVNSGSDSPTYVLKLDTDTSGNTVIQMGTPASNYVQVTEAGKVSFGGTGAFTNLVVDASANPYLHLNSTDVDWYWGIDDTGNELELRYNNASVGSGVVMQVADSTGNVTMAGTITVTGDATVTGNDLTFGNAESIDNNTNGTLDLNATGITIGSATDYLSITNDGTGVNITDTDDGTDDITIGDNGDNVIISAGNWDVDTTTADFGTLNLVTTGTIAGGIPSTSDANGMTQGEMTTAGMYNRMYWATGAGTWNLPGAAAGMNICVYSTTAAAVVVNPDNADQIKPLTNAVGDGATSASAAGDFICLVAIDATDWMVLGKSGSWTDSN
jgi:hypothetical protein